MQSENTRQKQEEIKFIAYEDAVDESFGQFAIQKAYKRYADGHLSNEFDNILEDSLDNISCTGELQNNDLAA